MTGISSDYQIGLYGRDFSQSLKGKYSYKKTGRHDKPAAYIQADYLPWDSETFGFSCARIHELWVADNSPECMRELNQGILLVLAQMEKDGIQFCDCRVDLRHYAMIHAMEKNGFHLMDVLNIYQYQTESIQSKKKLPYRIIGPARPDTEQVKELVALGKKSFKLSRLFQDVRIKQGQRDKFYGAMLEYFLNDKASHIHLAMPSNDQQPMGFVIGRPVSNDRACLWLIAIDEQMRGKGIGGALLDSFLADMKKTYTVVEIGTQVNNYSANAIYCNAGLRIAANVASFHRWFK